MHSHGGQGSPNNRSKGLVITRYGPPPSQYPPPAPQNAWGPPGGPYPPPAQPPPNPYAQQPPAPYHPPPPQSVPPYPPPYQNVNPPPGVYGPPVPPPPAPGPSYGQYGQPSYPPPAPPPQSYPPPGPYGPPSYAPPYQPPNPAYNGAPPPSFPGPPPPPAPPPTSYPPAYGNSAPPGPPPGLPSGLPPGLPPPPSIPYPPAPYSSGYEPQGAYPTPYPPPPSQSWHQSSAGHNHSRPRDHRDHRDRRNDRDKGGRNKQSGRGNDRHQRGRDRRNQGPGTRSSSNSRQRTPRLESEKREESVRTTPRIEDVKVDEKDSEADEEFSWDLEKAFIELDTKPADPVGKPLAADWSDEPTIPPAYNAKCVKSAFCDPESPDSLKLSVRGSKLWPKVKQDPVFRYRRGMVVVRFPGASHEYFTYHFSRKVETGSLTDREVVTRGPSDSSLNDAISPRVHHPAGSPAKNGQSVSESNIGKRGHENPDGNARDVKRLKVQPERIVHSLPPRPMSPRPRSRSPARSTNINVSVDPWSPQPDEAGRPDSRGRYSRSPGGYRLQKEDSNNKGHFTPRDSTQRYDSGYQSGYSGDRSKPYRERSHSRRLSPPPSRRGRDDRGPSRERSRDRSRDDQTPRKWSPSYAKARARTRSPTPIAAASDAESADLSDLEYELLGMERPEKKKKKTAPSKSVVKRRQVKMNDAFG